LVIPELEGKFDGYALRVPVPTVSVVDFVAELEQAATTKDLHKAFKDAEAGHMKGILGFSEEPLVSSDYVGDPRSSVIDAQFTKVVGDNMAKVVTWYDNEWGYSVRTADLAAIMAKSL
jgi:glyceraldehyde 3-phosphate dehydrogenase